MAPTEHQTMMSEMREMGIDPMGDIRSLGYEYRKGRLVRVGTDRGFEFKGAEEYEALAEAVTQYVPLLLEEEANLSPVWLPLGTSPGDGCPIFASRGYETAEKLLIIIQGSGRVLAGVWGCSLCINDSLSRGTMMPYLRKAVDAGYGLLVLNPNQNHVEGRSVPGSETFERHVAYVMDKVVMARCKAAEIDILAHSHGGRALLHYLGRSSLDRATLARKIQHIVFTDSYHSHGQLDSLPPLIRALLKDSSRCMNFVPHAAPLGTAVTEWFSQEYSFTAKEKGCACTSAGVLDHASTNYAAMEAVFEFLDAQCTPAAGGLCSAPALQLSRSLTGVEEHRCGITQIPDRAESLPPRLEYNQVATACAQPSMNQFAEDLSFEANPEFANPEFVNPVIVIPEFTMPKKQRRGHWAKMATIKKLFSRTSSKLNIVAPV